MKYSRCSGSFSFPARTLRAICQRLAALTSSVFASSRMILRAVSDNLAVFPIAHRNAWVSSRAFIPPEIPSDPALTCTIAHGFPQESSSADSEREQDVYAIYSLML